MNGPCHGCPNRRFKCHSECEKYQAFNAFCEERRKEQFEDVMNRPDFGTFQKNTRNFLSQRQMAKRKIKED